MKKILDLFLSITGGLFVLALGGFFFPKNVSSVQGLSAPVVEGSSYINIASPIVDGFSKVVRVIDGDTIEIEGGVKVRLIGIDTPELRQSGDSGCFGQEAKNYLSNLILGQRIGLEKDVSEVDRYGRLLRYVYLEDELINDALVRNGYARVSTYPPDVKYQQRFLDSEAYARQESLGLWSKCR